MKIVITGGPCSGKTAVINELQKLGYKTIPEAALELIHKENNGQKKVFPWTDMKKFQLRVCKLQLKSEKKIKKNEKVFLDRSIIDSIAYYNFYKNPLPNSLKEFKPDYDKVFFLEMLPEKYWKRTPNGKPRMQTYAQGKKIHKTILDAYDKYKIKTIVILAKPVKERVRLILSKL
jgi:predicted ATPase